MPQKIDKPNAFVSDAANTAAMLMSMLVSIIPVGLVAWMLTDSRDGDMRGLGITAVGCFALWSFLLLLRECRRIVDGIDALRQTMQAQFRGRRVADAEATGESSEPVPEVRLKPPPFPPAAEIKGEPRPVSFTHRK